MVANPFLPQKLVGRQNELQQVQQILEADGDLVIAGVPGSGRRTLIRWAAKGICARVIEIDCLRATDYQRFLQLLAEGIMAAFDYPTERIFIERWSHDQPVILEHSSNQRSQLVWHLSKGQEWNLLQILLTLPQWMAEQLSCRVVVMFQNFPHIRSWDRSGKWEYHLCQEIEQQSRVSYALIATSADAITQRRNLQVVALPPLKDEEIAEWIQESMAAEGFTFDAETQALATFLNYVQGNFGSAIALARRIWLDHHPSKQRQTTELDFPKDLATIIPNQPEPTDSIFFASTPKNHFLAYQDHFFLKVHHIHRSTLVLVEDLAPTFESLILLLPPSQVRVLESLALDPTDSPHSREYIQKHQLSRGGGLQGALASLEQKGLVYGSEYHYQITMPLLAFWLKQQLA
ncbi:MAG: ATP-binding protein [Scytolyngbya sp. HA4215-MV1]|jgi:hypothetical protein|nr:ATP-binding protein [Scytolyngbya sp. HA4215-MV1]